MAGGHGTRLTDGCNVPRKDVRGKSDLPRRDFGELIRLLVVPARHVVEFYAIELVLEGSHSFAVCFHLVVVTARILHDMVDHELRVSSHVEVLDACLNGDFEAAKGASYSAMLFDAGKWRRTAYLMCSPRGETKSRPALAPVFITDPLK
jgi:hypothetical protein